MSNKTLSHTYLLSNKTLLQRGDVMDRLKVTTISLGSKQLEFVKSKCDNVSRYIRSLIDREMGIEMVTLTKNNKDNDYYESNKPQQKEKPQPKTLDWRHLK
jgi:hypothetical protein